MTRQRTQDRSYVWEHLTPLKVKDKEICQEALNNIWVEAGEKNRALKNKYIKI
jgi:hypothetical protein